MDTVGIASDTDQALTRVCRLVLRQPIRLGVNMQEEA